MDLDQILKDNSGRISFVNIMVEKGPETCRYRDEFKRSFVSAVEMNRILRSQFNNYNRNVYIFTVEGVARIVEISTLNTILSKCSQIRDNLRRKLAIASVITKALELSGLDTPILVGGMVVATYSGGQYGTEDIDMYSPDSNKDIGEVLRQLGYVPFNRYFYNKAIESFIEFPSGKYAGSKNKVIKYIIEETSLPVYIEGIEDIILDRIDGYVATGDKSCEEWAVKLLGGMYKNIDWSYFHREANSKKTLDVALQLQRKAKKLLKQYQSIMSSIETETSASKESTNRMDLF